MALGEFALKARPTDTAERDVIEAAQKDPSRFAELPTEEFKARRKADPHGPRKRCCRQLMVHRRAQEGLGALGADGMWRNNTCSHHS